jgi:hypothetical protein
MVILLRDRNGVNKGVDLLKEEILVIVLDLDTIERARNPEGFSFCAGLNCGVWERADSDGRSGLETLVPVLGPLGPCGVLTVATLHIYIQST